MPTLILVAYATKHGSTGEVAEAIAATLRRADFAVDVMPAADVHNVDAYNGVVLGGALYMGRWHRDAVRFLDRFAVALDGKVLAVYAMGPLDLDDKDVSGSRKQLDHALAKSPAAEPDSIAIFGGVLDPSEHRFPFNHLPAGDAMRSATPVAAWNCAGVIW